MNHSPTLKERVSQISITVFFLTVAVLLTCFTLYSMKKARIAEEYIEKELSLNIKNQLDQFIPSFLLPEQKKGINLILSRIITNENLDHALIVQGQQDLPK